jgi:hypothetical protein
MSLREESRVSKTEKPQMSKSEDNKTLSCSFCTNRIVNSTTPSPKEITLKQNSTLKFQIFIGAHLPKGTNGYCIRITHRISGAVIYGWKAKYSSL